jgi:Inner membrane protein YgaP-like, transmembrane domain
MRYTNLSLLDRAIRILLGILMLAAGWAGLVTGVWGVALQVFGWIPLVTGVAGWCPIYAMMGISTLKFQNRRPPLL